MCASTKCGWTSCRSCTTPPDDSISGTTARNIEGRGRRERTFLARQPTHEGGDLLHPAQAPHGNLRFHVIDLALRQLREQRAGECRRGHAIHPDPGRGELLAE